MDRAEFLTLLDIPRQRGLEVGALNKPVVTRDMGPVEYVDRATRDELAAWYADPVHGVDPTDLVDVDHVWRDQSLLECVGGQRVYDYLIPSHVIEHVPDLFGWLGEIAGVLRDGGLAMFIVPDKRFTFDHRRQTSVSGDFVDAYLRRLRRPDTRQIFNHYNDTHHLGSPLPDDAERTRIACAVLDMCRRVETSGEYIDGHCWVFTPQSLAEALDLANRLDLLPFEVVRLTPTQPGSIEFPLALRRLPDSLDAAARRAAFVASLETIDLADTARTGDTADVEELRAEATMAIARAAAIETSTIWRLTAPLRRALDRLRGRGG